MTARHILTLAGIALMLTTTTGLARNHAERPDFATLDADGSGEITVEDLAVLRDQRFDDADRNSDGQIDREEFVAQARDRAADRASQMFDRLDADGDGVLSQDALAAQSNEGRSAGRGIERMISRFDADNSGGISAEEFKAAADQMARRGGKRDGKRQN